MLQARIDAEMLCLACILHDLGLTEKFQGDLPFEIQGGVHWHEGMITSWFRLIPVNRRDSRGCMKVLSRL